MDKVNDDLAGRVMGCAMQVPSAFEPDFPESVDQNALGHERREVGLEVAAEVRLPVNYDEESGGACDADMFVDKVLLIENKAIQRLVPIPEVPWVNYLTATGLTEEGVRLNFGSARLESKKKFCLDQSSAKSVS